MATLRLKNLIWHIRYRDRRGKQRETSTEIKTSKQGDKLAQKKLEDFERDRRAGKEPGDSIPIGKLLDAVVEDYSNNRRKSPATLEFRIANLRPWFGSIRCDKLSKSDVLEYVTDRRKEGANNATINRELSVLRRAFSLGREHERTDRAPYMPKLRESEPRQGFFTREQVDAFVPHLPDAYQDFVMFLFLTGCRINEARQLEWRHVDFKAEELYFEATMTKSGKGRSFPITAELNTLLNRVKDARPKTLLPHVFVYERWHGRQAKRRKTDRAAEYRPIGTITKAWNSAMKKADLPPAWRHDLRRAAARIFDRAAIPPKVAMELLGHTTEAMRLRYNITSESDRRIAKERLDAWEKRGKPVEAVAEVANK